MKQWIYGAIGLAFLIAGFGTCNHLANVTGVAPSAAVFVISEAQAQPAPEPTAMASPVGLAAGEGAEGGETPPTTKEVLEGVQTVINDWKTFGWLAGIMSLVTLLIQVTKLGPVKEFFKSNPKWKVLRPALAVVSAGLLGAASATETGANPFMSGLLGVLLGLSSVGAFEIYSWMTGKRGKEAEAKAKNG